MDQNIDELAAEAQRVMRWQRTQNELGTELNAWVRQIDQRVSVIEQATASLVRLERRRRPVTHTAFGVFIGIWAVAISGWIISILLLGGLAAVLSRAAAPQAVPPAQRAPTTLPGGR